MNLISGLASSMVINLLLTGAMYLGVGILKGPIEEALKDKTVKTIAIIVGFILAAISTIFAFCLFGSALIYGSINLVKKLKGFSYDSTFVNKICKMIFWSGTCLGITLCSVLISLGLLKSKKDKKPNNNKAIKT